MQTAAGGGSQGARSPLAALLAAALLLALAVPPGAAAFTDGTTYTLDIKVPPSKFQAGTQLDIPLYLVENRPGAGGGSQLAEYKLGDVFSSFDSTQSKFLQLTPVAGLEPKELIARDNPEILQFGAQSLVQFWFHSSTGMPVTPDNSGITGRTEVLIGTLRTEVGPAIPQTNGRPIVFEMTIRPAGGESGVSGAGPGLGSIVKRQIQVFADPPEELDDGKAKANAKAKAACAQAKNKVQAAKKQATKAQRAVGKAARQVQRAGAGKKGKAQRQAKQARTRAKQAKQKLKRLQGETKKSCG